MKQVIWMGLGVGLLYWLWAHGKLPFPWLPAPPGYKWVEALARGQPGFGPGTSGWYPEGTVW